MRLLVTTKPCRWSNHKSCFETCSSRRTRRNYSNIFKGDIFEIPASVKPFTFSRFSFSTVFCVSYGRRISTLEHETVQEFAKNDKCMYYLVAMSVTDWKHCCFEDYGRSVGLISIELKLLSYHSDIIIFCRSVACMYAGSWCSI